MQTRNDRRSTEAQVVGLRGPLYSPFTAPVAPPPSDTITATHLAPANLPPARLPPPQAAAFTAFNTHSDRSALVLADQAGSGKTMAYLLPLLQVAGRGAGMGWGGGVNARAQWLRGKQERAWGHSVCRWLLGEHKGLIDEGQGEGALSHTLHDLSPGCTHTCTRAHTSADPPPAHRRCGRMSWLQAGG